MTRETIKEYILQVKSQDGTEALYNRWEPDILVEVINEIFNDHEAQLKEVNRVKEDFRKVAVDLDAEASELRAQLKESNDEINRLNIENKQLIEHITSGALLKPLVFCHSCKKEIK